MSSLIENHPFVDGNKRTGITAAGVFLEENLWCLVVSQDNLEDFTVRVTTERLDVETIAAWLQQGCQPLHEC
jgi:death on curing protein